ncbi:MAG: hypothetical protein HFE76_06170 [Firmicutes bacterium]|nr:hypothetical protein [Bacillota bacterium]
MVESKLDFTFADRAIKFDDTRFYEVFKSYLPNGKGVDFLSINQNAYIMLEVKNCTGYERENAWRTKTDFINENGEDSFDIEVAKKVAGTLACLAGAGIAYTMGEADELKPYFQELASAKYEKGKKALQVILFLEGNFRSKTRTKKMIMKRIRDKISEKLRWSNCTVRVVDLDTYHNNGYSVESITA